MEPKMANDLCMRWVPVTDDSGRKHMEAVWITAAAPAAVPTAVSHAA